MNHTIKESLSARLVSSFFKFNRTRWHNAPADGLSLAETNILENIQRSRRRGNIPRVSDLSTVLHVSSSTITQHLNNLEEGGFVQRNHSKKDKRTVDLSLTQRGEEALNSHWVKLESDFTEFVELLGEQDAELMIKLLMQAYEFFNQKYQKAQIDQI